MIQSDQQIRNIEEISLFSILRPTKCIPNVTPSDTANLGRGFIHVGTEGKLVLEVIDRFGQPIEITITNFVGGWLDRFIISKVKTATEATQIDFYNIL